jgi:hypothetical protein
VRDAAVGDEPARPEIHGFQAGDPPGVVQRLARCEATTAGRSLDDLRADDGSHGAHLT